MAIVSVGIANSETKLYLMRHIIIFWKNLNFSIFTELIAILKYIYIYMLICAFKALITQSIKTYLSGIFVF